MSGKISDQEKKRIENLTRDGIEAIVNGEMSKAPYTLTRQQEEMKRVYTHYSQKPNSKNSE